MLTSYRLRVPAEMELGSTLMTAPGQAPSCDAHSTDILMPRVVLEYSTTLETQHHASLTAHPKTSCWVNTSVISLARTPGAPNYHSEGPRWGEGTSRSFRIFGEDKCQVLHLLHEDRLGAAQEKDRGVMGEQATATAGG